MSPLSKARNEARRQTENAVAILAHALNACDNSDTPYRYGKEEQERFKALVCALIVIVEHGEIELSASAKAKYDKDFQRFMKALTAY